MACQPNVRSPTLYSGRAVGSVGGATGQRHRCERRQRLGNHRGRCGENSHKRDRSVRNAAHRAAVMVGFQRALVFPATSTGFATCAVDTIFSTFAGRNHEVARRAQQENAQNQQRQNR